MMPRVKEATLLASLALLWLATPAFAKETSPWPGSDPPRLSAPAVLDDDDIWVDHTVQEDGVGFEEDLARPPAWAGNTDDFRSIMIPPDKLVPNLIGLDPGAERMTSPGILGPTIDPLASLFGGDGAFDGAAGWPSASAGGTGLDPGPAILRDYQFDPSPSYAIGFDEAIAAGLIFQDELVDLALPVDDVSPFAAGEGNSVIPAPGALLMLGVASILGHRRRRAP